LADTLVVGEKEISTHLGGAWETEGLLVPSVDGIIPAFERFHQDLPQGQGGGPELISAREHSSAKGDHTFRPLPCPSKR